MIEDLLKNKTAKEKANIKAHEIAKLDFRGIHNNSLYGIKIDVVDVNAFDGGIEIFARAWRGNKQIGFGKNGTVDIERFRIHMSDEGRNNHLSWLVVEDPNGDITVDYNSRELDGSLTTTQKKYREDPEQAIYDCLVKMVRNKAVSDNIVKGKIGNTSSSFISNAGGDGRVLKQGSVWTTIRSSATADVAATGDSEAFLFAGDLDATTFGISWSPIPFDTSGLPDGDTINSATVDLRQGNTNGEGNRSIALILGTQASPTTLAVEDYDERGGLSSVVEGATRITMDTADTDFQFTLNGTGLGWIDATGFTKLGLRGGFDIDNTTPSVRNFTKVTMADDATAANRPTLVVDHNEPITFTPKVMMF